MNRQHSYDSHSSFSNSPVINYRKDAKKGIKFTFMVVGELGTGKTTFINSLLDKKVLAHKYSTDSEVVGETKTLAFTTAKSVALPNISVLTRSEFNATTANEEPGIALTLTSVEMLDDDNTKLLLNIIDTPGFRQNLNNEVCFSEIENYLKLQFDTVLAEETRIKRNSRFADTRVHAMLYFITPTGHGLREIDIACMKRLARYVNVIPVIGRADSFTPDELERFKEHIRVDIEKFNVPVFQFDSSLGDYDSDEDYDLIQEIKHLTSIQPFAVISSEDEYEVSDPNTGERRTIKARQYPWGLVDIHDPSYSDFSLLKSVLLGSHLQDLKDLTHDFLYETYRTERLTKVTGGFLNEDDKTAEEDEQGHQDVLTTAREAPVPSFSNLAQLTSLNPLNEQEESSSITSRNSGKAPRSMLLDDDEQMPSPKLKDTASFTSSTSTISFDGYSLGKSLNGNHSNSNGNAFKRYSIGPQRNQLRQISETVPYVIRQERLLERQKKLEEMEIASAKELAQRAALLEKKAAELKARERAISRRFKEEQEHDQEQEQDPDHEDRFSSAVSLPISDTQRNDEGDTTRVTNSESRDNVSSVTIRKEETFNDLHSIVSQR